MDERLERHLCNLHNEVFEAAESRINTECSLIICEGISSWQCNSTIDCRFPHYMWGYIYSGRYCIVLISVPSLYVRVYRARPCYQSLTACSLIICEGISATLLWIGGRPPFPHYMWGYIVRKIFIGIGCRVPSLYVRVYRIEEARKPVRRSSLIICEGISDVSHVKLFIYSFPHYMWGYIGLQGLCLPVLYVPSLYVRVYRCLVVLVSYLSSSLIICEGISRLKAFYPKHSRFPHYMWGYIVSVVMFWRERSVPSLYVRVYRI